MADDLPSNAQFRLPDDLRTLAQMRDQLSDYLNTLERNTDATNDWLARNQNTIIVGHHQLNRAIGAKDAAAAAAAIDKLGDSAGFVLSLQDFDARAAEAFGAGAAITKKIAGIRRGIPESVLEELPELKMPEADAPIPEVARPAAEAAPLPAPAPKKWWQFGGNNAEKQAADAEAEAAARIEEIKRNWKLVRSELISLQSERHYYIDSFMDWVGETLEPESGAADPEAEADKLMEKYQNPQYVIDLAVRDYAEVMEVKARALENKALQYSALAALVDAQDIAGFVKVLPNLFPKPETIEAKQQKDLLLQDFGVISFAELALNVVKTRDDQLLLLETALQLEPDFKLSGVSTKRGVFERVLKETLDANDPLKSKALTLTLQKLRKSGADGGELIGIKDSGASIFERIAQRFDKTLLNTRLALGDLLEGLGGTGRSPHLQLGNFLTLVNAPTPDYMLKVIEDIGKNGAQPFKALYQLTYPNRSLVADITKSAGQDKAQLAKLMDAALTAGLLDEFKAESNAPAGKAENIIRFFNEEVMTAPNSFSLLTARRLIGTSFANGGLDRLRQELTKPDGWLAQIAAGPMAQEGRLSWIAALLEPYASPLVKANILIEAAEEAKNPAAAETLRAIEANMAGNNIRLEDGRILTNLDRIANIWYSQEAKTLRFTVGGASHLMAENISPAMAQEVLTHIQRKFPAFQPEYDGLYNPANLERVITGPQGTNIRWQNRSGVLNVPDITVENLHRHADFLHVQTKNGTESIHQSAIALLQPLSDGSNLLVDKYGDVQVLEGRISWTPGASLVDLGGGAYFNPGNAGILSLNPAKKAVEFRCESKDFDGLIDSAAPGEYFYSVPVTSADGIQKLQDAVNAAPAIATAGGAYGQLYFNFATLGYMMYTEDRETGFHCRRFGPSKKPGFISAEDDMARAIFDGLSANKNLVSIGNVITHKSVIDDIYYISDRQRVYALLGNDLLQATTDEATAYKAMKPLSEEEGFTTVGAVTIKNPVKSGVGFVELPADIVNLGRTVLQFYSDAQEKTLLVGDNERFFHIGFDAAEARKLFDALEDKGLAAAKAQTPKTLGWTAKLGDVSAALPQQSLRLTPSLTDTGREYLLQQLIGTPGENRDMPKPKADFAIAAAPVKANDNLAYPVQPQRNRPAAAPRARIR